MVSIPTSPISTSSREITKVLVYKPTCEAIAIETDPILIQYTGGQPSAKHDLKTSTYGLMKFLLMGRPLKTTIKRKLNSNKKLKAILR